MEKLLDAGWLSSGLEDRAAAYAIEHLVPEHLREVRERREDAVTRTEAAVKERLEAEIRYWDHRALELREQELAGKQPRMNPTLARRRVDVLEERFRRRLDELAQERQVSALPPVVVGGALVVPVGMVSPLTPQLMEGLGYRDMGEGNRAEVERLAMEAVMAAERALGRTPEDVSKDRVGYDVLSRRADGSLVFLEVKGRVAGAETVTDFFSIGLPSKPGSFTASPPRFRP